MAEIITLARNLFEAGLQYFFNHKIIAVIWILFCIAILVISIRDMKEDMGELKPVRRVCAYLYIIVSVLYVLFLGSVFTVASDVYEASPELFTTRLYVIVIVISVIDAVLRFIVMHADPKLLNNDEFMDHFKEAAKSCVVVIISLIFIFTDLESGIINWGFTLFGRKIGGWIFNFYSGWALARFLDFVQLLLQWPFLPGFITASDD